jgi:2,5-diamino-6-(ribosylamino)-4(3H)-pyrimidinone 5'-phosphate reductase
MRPRVTVHDLVSVDGRLTGFPADLGLYYGIAARVPHQAVLTGSRTLLAGAEAEGIDLTADDPAAAPGAHAAGPAEPAAGPGGPTAGSGGSAAGSGGSAAGPGEPAAGPGEPALQPPSSPAADAAATAAEDPAPWLAVVDGGGRIAAYGWLRTQPYWRDVVALCCAATPAAHLERLERQHVEHVVAGDAHVDLDAALRALHDRFGVREVRVDAGGTLNGQLLARGLVDEVSVVVAPHLVGTQTTAVHLVDVALGASVPLDLLAVERLPGGHVWLRYGVGDGTP